MTKRWRMRLTVVGVITALAVALGVSVAIVVADPPPQPSPARASDFKPAPPPDFGPRPTTLEEERQWREQVLQEARAKGFPGELGIPSRELRIAGRTITLPADASVGGMILAIEGCEPGPCPKPPLHEIMRGNSIVWVSSDGKLLDSGIVKGEEHLFEFLREALR